MSFKKELVFSLFNLRLKNNSKVIRKELIREMSLPTTIEAKAIQKFRKRVEDILSPKLLENDMFLVRWLRARDLNLDKAEGMLRNSMKWREENNVDFALEKKADEYFVANFPFDLSCRDRDGRALLLIPLGSWDVCKAINDGKGDEIQGYFNYYFESLMHAIGSSVSADPNHPHTQLTVVCNWEGYSLRQFASIRAAQSVLKLGSTYEAHYPEILFQGYCINCSRPVQMLFALAKKMFPERTMQKVHLFGFNRDEWEWELNKQVDLKIGKVARFIKSAQL